MLGWNEGDSVEIESLPEPDPAAIAGISLETDIEQALENNYDLKNFGQAAAERTFQHNRSIGQGNADKRASGRPGECDNGLSESSSRRKSV